LISISANIPPPSVVTEGGFGSFNSSSSKKLPNLDLIANINATLAKKGFEPSGKYVKWDTAQA